MFNLVNINLSVPYNNDFKLLEELIKVKKINGNEIKEIYLSGPQKISGSCRVTTKFTKKDLIDVIKFCHNNGIEVNLILNSICEGIEWYEPTRVSKTVNFIKRMRREGLDSVTIANPLYLQKIRQECPDTKITTSVISEIASVQRALFFKKFGTDTITPDRDINRNLKKLKNIKEVGCELKLLVDEVCLYRCPFRIFHKNYTSHYSIESYEEEFDPFGICRKIESLDPSQLLKSPWIRPEDLKKYKKITNFFKIEGRTLPTKNILEQTKSYLMEKTNDSMPEFFKKVPYDFFDKVTSCDKNCSKCHYCNNLAKEIF